MRQPVVAFSSRQRFTLRKTNGMNPITWARRSIRRRGLLQTSKVAGSVARDFFFDWRYGTDTRRMVDADDLETESENKSRAVQYQATKAWSFLKLLRAIQIPSDGTFVDIGSGKGRALLIAAHYGFKRSVGIEFSPQLCAIARKNVATFQKSSLLRSEIEVIEGDAALCPIESEMNVFYMYNPFDAVVLSRVLANIGESVAQSPRKIWLIYNTPLHHDVIERSGIFGDGSFREIGGTEFRIYAN